MRHWCGALMLSCLLATPAAARPSLVCRVTARVPFNTLVSPGADSTRVFTQTALLVEERRSGGSDIRRWTVIADTPEQVVAVDPARTLTLVLDRPGASFAISGVGTQQRGYCWVNDLP